VVWGLYETPSRSKSKTIDYINKARGQITEAKIREWFKETEELLENNIGVLHDPTRVFNMDET